MPSPLSEDLRQKVVDAVPRNRGTVITMVGALRMEGLVAMMTIQGGVCSDVFVSYVKQVLVPALQPGDIVVVDNLAAHKDPRVAELLDSVDASLLFLPPYSPDLNPIEECWSKVKGLLRTAKARTRQALDEAGARPVTVTVTVTVTAHGPRSTVHGPRPTAHGPRPTRRTTSCSAAAATTSIAWTRTAAPWSSTAWWGASSPASPAERPSSRAR